MISSLNAPTSNAVRPSVGSFAATTSRGRHVFSKTKNVKPKAKLEASEDVLARREDVVQESGTKPIRARRR